MGKAGVLENMHGQCKGNSLFMRSRKGSASPAGVFLFPNSHDILFYLTEGQQNLFRGNLCSLAADVRTTTIHLRWLHIRVLDHRSPAEKNMIATNAKLLAKPMLLQLTMHWITQKGRSLASNCGLHNVGQIPDSTKLITWDMRVEGTHRYRLLFETIPMWNFVPQMAWWYPRPLLDDSLIF